MKNQITVAEVSTLADPTLQKIAKRVVREMDLAIARTVAHHVDAKKYPLPADRNSVEWLLWQRYQELSPEQRQLAASRIMPRLEKGAPVMSRALGDLAAVDLQSSMSVAEQVDKLPVPAGLKLSPATLERLRDLHGPVVVVDEDGLAPQQTTNHLEFRIHKVICDDETNANGLEIGSDEIAMAGSAIDETGDTHSIAEFRVMNNVDDGDVKTFNPPRRFTTFDLREGTNFPKSYFVTLILAEKDAGGLSKFVNQFLDKVTDRVKTHLAAAIGGAVGAAGGPVGAAIGVVAGIAVDQAFRQLKAAFADEIFPPKTVSVNIPSLTHRFKGGKTDSPEVTSVFKDHGGTYRVISDFRLIA